MGVPIEIRQVKRPVNTIVQDTGKEGPKRYPVRERKGSHYVSGGNPQPVNGKVVGYIINYEFIPICEKTSADIPSMLSYGAATLVKETSEDILSDLLQIFPPNDAYTILSLAALKVVKPKVSCSRMGSVYQSSFLSIFYPGAALSHNSISSIYKKAGEDGKKRALFYERRMSRVCEEDHILIDGTLKQDTSHINDLSSFSYKARIKGCEDISILYAHDLEKMEPICAQVFPGNSVDAVSYKAFVRDNKIMRGIIISDKGFPPNEIRNILAKEPLLYYLTPVKRNDKRIKDFGLTEFNSVLSGIDRIIQCKKVNVSTGIWLYAFRDVQRAAAEEKSFLEKSKETDSYDPEKYQKKKKSFGLIVFESNKDMSEKSAYLSYEERWKLELVFKAYKNDECLDRTSVQGDFSIYGSEFVNFISTLITCRIITRATKAGLFNEMSYGDMMDDLNSAWRKTDTPIETKPTTEDCYWVHTIPKVFSILERLDLSLPVSKEPRKRGPKSKKNTLQVQAESETSGNTSAMPDPQKDQIEKRRPGRPRIHPLPDPGVPKRPVGRPRTRPLPDPNAPKRPVGRPRTRPIPDPDTPKKPVGRPRKIYL